MNKIKMKSEFDGLDLSVLIIEPKGKAKGIVQISHGMAEHKERYIPFMDYLSKNGYITIINDHRGHGESVNDKKDLGYFYDDTGDGIVEDLHQITLYAKDKYPKLPLYLFGHSMGSMVVRKYLKKFDKDIEKLIICGSPSKNNLAGVALNFVKILSKFKSDYYRSSFVNHLAFLGYNKKFRDSTSVNAWICGNDEELKKYDEDELCGFIFTLNGFINLFKLMKDIYEKKGYLVRNNKLPILFIAGANDPVIKSEKGWQSAQTFLKNIGYNNVKGIIYPEMRHEILKENGKEKVFQDIFKFIEE